MEPRRPAAHPSADRPRNASTLILQLLRKLAGPLAQPRIGTTRKGDAGTLPAPGSRSGQGSASVAPYLDQERNTRPGPLE